MRAYHRGEDFAVSRTVPATVAAGGFFPIEADFGEAGSLRHGRSALACYVFDRYLGKKEKN
ncbi:MAG: hypothetical protein ACLR06_13600 [Christensenellaceae bacterium]